MSADSLLVKVRLNDGNVTDFPCAEILEINGKPFVSAESVDDRINSLIDELNRTNGRLEQVCATVDTLITAIATPRDT